MIVLNNIYRYASAIVEQRNSIKEYTLLCEYYLLTMEGEKLEIVISSNAKV
jgi:hypothetical protein